MGKRINKKRIFWIIFIVAVVIAGILITFLFALIEDKLLSMDANNFYPDKYMVKEFIGGSENNRFSQIVENVKHGKVQIRQIDIITNVVMIYDLSPEYIKLIFTKEIDKEDLKDDYIDELIPNREDFILKAPIVIGTKWHDETGGTYEIIKTNAIVDIPAGKFETVVVKYTNDEFTVKEYYARNVGLVKIIINNYEVYELKKISY